MSIIVLFFFCGILFLTVICLITFIVLGTASISLGSAFLILLRVFTLKENHVGETLMIDLKSFF
nr:hypothetical protein [uncultured Mogibacterium sp.]